MAKIVNDINVTNLTKQDFLNQTLDTYSSFLNEIPTYVDYLSINIPNSLNEASLHNIEELLGDDSPIKLNKTSNFPIYKFEKLDPQSDVDGNVIIQGSAVVIPNTLKPEIDDLFIVTSSNMTRELFRINSVDKERMRGKQFYKISFYLYDLVTPTEVINQVIEEFETVTTFNLDEISIIKKTTAEQIEELLTIRNLLQNYLSMFHDKRVNLYVYRFETQATFPNTLPNNVTRLIPNHRNTKEYTIYDHRLQYFIQRHKLLARNNPYRNELFFNLLEYNHYSEINYFKKSILYSVENKNINNIFGNGYVLTPFISGVYNPYEGHYNSDVFEPISYNIPVDENELIIIDDLVSDIEYLDDLLSLDVVYDDLVGVSRELYKVSDSFIVTIGNFVEYYNDNNDLVIPTVESHYASILKSYINNNLTITSLIEELNSIDFKASFQDYYFIPMMIYIINKTILEENAKNKQ